MIEGAGPGVRWMRDPTRGGVATSLNELARDCGLGIVLSEEGIPMRDEVAGHANCLDWIRCISRMKVSFSP